MTDFTENSIPQDVVDTATDVAVDYTTYFSGPAKARSSTPEVDGYEVIFTDLPHHAHPTETPGVYNMLMDAINAGVVTVTPWVEPTIVPTVPKSVSAAQGRKALILAGVYASEIDSIINSITDNAQRELAKVDWEYSTVFNRDNPLVLLIQGVKNWTDAQVDELFITAGGL